MSAGVANGSALRRRSRSATPCRSRVTIPARPRVALVACVGGSRYAKDEPVAKGAQRFERCSVSSSQRSRSNANGFTNRARTERTGSSDPPQQATRVTRGRAGIAWP